MASGIGSQIGKGMSVAFADYDGDGFSDIFVTNDAVPDFLFHNKGNGTFEEIGCWKAWPCRRTGGRCRAWAPTSATWTTMDGPTSS